MGKPYIKRRHAEALAAYNLKQRGYTFREISEQLGIYADRVSDCVKRGERLSSLDEKEQQK